MQILSRIMWIEMCKYTVDFEYCIIFVNTGCLTLKLPKCTLENQNSPLKESFSTVFWSRSRTPR